jgi:GAF domain-containing protein
MARPLSTQREHFFLLLPLVMLADESRLPFLAKLAQRVPFAPAGAFLAAGLLLIALLTLAIYAFRRQGKRPAIDGNAGGDQVRTVAPAAAAPAGAGQENDAPTTEELAVALHQAELFKATQRQLQELSVLHAVASAGAEASSEDDLIEHVTQIIGETLYPDDFGILLTNSSGTHLKVPPSYRTGNGPGNELIPLGKGVTGSVAESGQPMRIGDVRLTEMYIETRPGTRSELCVPLKVGRRVIGVLNVESDRQDAFSAKDERLLTTLAGQLATAIEKVRLLEQAQQEIKERKRAEMALRSAHHRLEQRVKERTAELTLLNRASRALVTTLDLEELLEIVLGEARRLLNVAACSVWLEDRETGEIVCELSTGPRHLVQGWRMAPGEGIAGWVTQSGQSLVIRDAQQDERHNPQVGEAINLVTRSLLCVPLIVKGKPIGVLQALDILPNRFDDNERELMESLAAVAASAVENARLYEQARQDAETKSILLQEVNHRVKNNLSVIMGLLFAEQRRASIEDQEAYQSVMLDLGQRVQGLAVVHSLLSAAEWSPLLLTELARHIIRTSLRALPPEHRVDVTVSPSPVHVSPEQAHNIALVLNELVTNTIKYGLQDATGAISVTIGQTDDLIELAYEDNGPGYPEHILQAPFVHGTVGFHLLQNIVERSLRGSAMLRNKTGGSGAVTVVQFKAEV